MTFTGARKIKLEVSKARRIAIVQADNPDADSLGSALALEYLLGAMQKEVFLYCSVDMPNYLHYMRGWDRVSKDLPKQFDMSIIVDASTRTLLDKLESSGQLHWIAAKPSVVLDHHSKVERPLDFASVTINAVHVSSTGELLYWLGRQLGWHINREVGEYIMSAILGDTQGLSNTLATADTYRVMADLIEVGVDRAALEETRREFSKMPLPIFKYKASLIERTAFAADGRVAHVSIPQAEINEYSPLYNPVPLIQNDMLQTTGVAIAIVFKQYDDGKVTGAIRSNMGYPIAAELAAAMGGGGHDYASGFKVTSSTSIADVRTACLDSALRLLATLK